MEDGDPLLLAERGGFERATGGDFAQDGDHLVARDEFAGDGRGFTGLALGILDQMLELAAEQTASGIDFLKGQLGSLVGGLTKRGFATGQGGKFPDDDVTRSPAARGGSLRGSTTARCRFVRRSTAGEGCGSESNEESATRF